MNDAAAQFIDELRAHPRFAVIAEPVAAALNATDLEGDGSTDALVFYEALMWVLEHKNRSIEERTRRALETG